LPAADSRRCNSAQRYRYGMRLAVRLMRDKRRIIPSRTVADQAQKDRRDPESRNGASRSYVATFAPPNYFQTAPE
jgi:hypothetical protein